MDFSCVQPVQRRGGSTKLSCLRTADTRISPVLSVDFLLSFMLEKGMMTMFWGNKVRPGRFYDYDPKTKQPVRIHKAEFESFKSRNQSERALPLTNRYQLAARGALEIGKALFVGTGYDTATSNTVNCPNCEAQMVKTAYQHEKNEVGLYDLVYVCGRCGFRWFVPDSVINPKKGRS